MKIKQRSCRRVPVEQNLDIVKHVVFIPSVRFLEARPERSWSASGTLVPVLAQASNHDGKTM